MTDCERNADVSKTLTEQWKSGKLEQGWYYVKGADGLFCMMSDYALYRVNLEHPDNTISLLAPVPSYEEWQASYNCMLENEVLRLKNAQLKELLKECREILDYAKDFAYHDPCCKCIAKINQVLGE